MTTVVDVHFNDCAAHIVPTLHTKNADSLRREVYAKEFLMMKLLIITRIKSFHSVPVLLLIITTLNLRSTKAFLMEALLIVELTIGQS